MRTEAGTAKPCPPLSANFQTGNTSIERRGSSVKQCIWRSYPLCRWCRHGREFWWDFWRQYWMRWRCTGKRNMLNHQDSQRIRSCTWKRHGTNRWIRDPRYRGRYIRWQWYNLYINCYYHFHHLRNKENCYRTCNHNNIIHKGWR